MSTEALEFQYFFTFFKVGLTQKRYAMISIRHINHSKLFMATIILTLFAAAQTASASERHFHGPRISFGFGIGFGPFGHPYPSTYGRNYYQAPYYPYQSVYYPAVMVSTIVTPAPVYVRQSEIVSTRPVQSTQIQPEVRANGGDWYYCHNPDGFYPSIKACPSGWQRVPAQAPSDR